MAPDEPTPTAERPRRRSAAILDRLCAATALGAGQDPIGTAPRVDTVLAVEMPTPWTRAGAEPDRDGSIPQRVMAAQRDARAAARRAGQPTDGTSTPGRVYGIAPDPEWSDPRLRRVIVATRPGATSGTYDVAEYHLPVGSDDVVDLVETALLGPGRPGEMGRFDRFRVERPDVVELLVCTHGSRDICCARFGMPLYRQARAHAGGVRAWRTMHFGGHRYAPTAWELPSGYMWGFLGQAAAAALLERGPLDALARNVRGWSGVPRRVQPLDRVGLLDHGWDWLAFDRTGSVIDADDERSRWRVRLDFTTPDGVSGRYEGLTVVARRLRAVGCGAGWGRDDHLVDELALESWHLVEGSGGR